MKKPNTIEDFFALIQKGPDCWDWTGNTNVGYGDFRARTLSKERFAHRLMYELTYGPIPDGMFICHTCDRRICVNPRHLFLGTPDDNVKDAAVKGRLIQRRFTDLQKATMRSMYADGVPVREIGRAFSVSSYVVRKICKHASRPQKSEICLRHWAGEAQKSIATDFKVSTTTIIKALKERGAFNPRWYWKKPI